MRRFLSIVAVLALTADASAFGLLRSRSVSRVRSVEKVQAVRVEKVQVQKVVKVQQVVQVQKVQVQQVKVAYAVTPLVQVSAVKYYPQYAAVSSYCPQAAVYAAPLLPYATGQGERLERLEKSVQQLAELQQQLLQSLKK